VFAEVDEETFNLDASRLTEALDAALQAGLRRKAIMAVDLFGLPADYAPIEKFATDHGLWLLADAAQSFGATYQERKVGTFGLATATSFFPAKPLGCYGDGGAIFTDHGELAALLDSIRTHGKGTDKYDNVRIGINGRLDTLQAAILIEKLAIFPEEIVQRQRAAERYHDLLGNMKGVSLPQVPHGSSSVWAQYTLRVPAMVRGPLAKALHDVGVPTAIYYPKPLHHQTAYRHYPYPKGGLVGSERLSSEVLSIPMHPYLSVGDQERVANAIRTALG
jgi:dTDP-4-amino-4,6-dideoxygalactose transaminase